MPQVPVPQPPLQITGELDAGEGAMPLSCATAASITVTVKDTVYEITPDGDGLRIICVSEAIVVAPQAKNHVLIVPVRGM